MQVAVNDIHVGARLRQADPAKVRELAESIAELGLINPITITPACHLVAGLHRLEAHRLLGLAHIEAQVADLDDTQAELLEIDENLVRNDLTVLERSEYLARRKELYEDLHPETQAFSHERQSQRRNGQPSEIISFGQDTAAKTGVTPRTIQQEVQIANAIPADVRDLLRHTPAADSKTDLLRLARLAPEQQRQVAGILADGSTDKVREAMRQVTHDKPEPEPIQGKDHIVVQPDEELVVVKKGKPESLHVSDDSYEWFTPAEYIEAARRVMGSIDTDPASCAEANTVVQAGTYYTVDDDGLLYEWPGNVWLNPPYNMPWIEKFALRAVEEYLDDPQRSIIVLTNNSSDTAWFHALLDTAMLCLTRGRIRFWSTGGEVLATRQGQAIFYMGPHRARFATEFARFGAIVETV